MDSIDPSTQDLVDLLAERLGHRFADPRLATAAVTHASLAHEGDEEQPHYERLEFLGDAVLGLLTAEWLYRSCPDRPEGDLARRKSYLVSAPVLADHARALGLGEVIRLGVGEERSGGRDKGSILADVVESLFGALYLDGGLDAVSPAVVGLLERATAHRPRSRDNDSKTQLQELTQSRGLGLPVYPLISTEGPDHAKRFTVACEVAQRELGRATRGSKKRAEQEAAAQALRSLRR